MRMISLLRLPLFRKFGALWICASQDEAITSKAEIERTVSRVLTENNDHGKNTTLSEIGSILQKKFSEFDVRNYGYSKLSTFLEV